ncbi:hypothetical protein CPB84DRAFT_1800506 [Gymnopilus junonius]|uniref:Uncharacterized protein n=1 Tax=Gymnopilus junonius TaxID=109634 RepID=A0A9P5N7D3_GYMJU|nr:hypothetical protein CPB84DRAFT_1800506 [Gymnopilus junonius]
MPMHVFDLDYDSFCSICGLLSRSDLRALSSLSKNGFNMVVPALVRTVTLLDFCNFALKHALCPSIISLTGYIQGIDIPHADMFASALIEVLEKATNLAHLRFKGRVNALLESQPRIANIVCDHPPALSFELSWADLHPLKSFTSISGLVHLDIRTSGLPRYYGEQEEAVEAIVMNSSSTLETISLGHAVPICLRLQGPPPFSCIRVRHLSMLGSSVLPEKVALMFPNLQSLEMRQSLTVATTKASEFEVRSPPLLLFDCPPRTLWTGLRSFSGPRQLAFNLTRHHPLRRISFKHHSPYSDASEFIMLSDTFINSDIRSFSLEVNLLEGGSDLVVSSADGIRVPSLLDPLFSALSHSGTSLTFLSIRTGKLNGTIPLCVGHLIRNASLLAPLRNLKYIQLEAVTWSGFIFAHDPVDIISATPEEIVQAWATGVPSLQYLALNVVSMGWGHSWWRIEPRDRTYRRLSEEEGTDTQNWYDLEEWK